MERDPDRVAFLIPGYRYSGPARGLGGPVHEADDADHGLETDADPVNSADILRRTTVAMDEFVARL